MRKRHTLTLDGLLIGASTVTSRREGILTGDPRRLFKDGDSKSLPVFPVSPPLPLSPAESRRRRGSSGAAAADAAKVVAAAEEEEEEEKVPEPFF